MGWIETFKGLYPPTQVASALGMEIRLKHAKPCPACKADSRGSEDRRGPVGFGASGGWRCFACDEAGDSVALMAWGVLGKDALTVEGEEWDRLRAWADEHGLRAEAQEPTGPRRGRARGSKVKSLAAMVDAATGGGTRRQKPARGSRASGGASTPGDGSSDGPGESVATPGGLYQWDPGLVERCEAALWEPGGLEALAYLTETRRLSDEAIRAFRLGMYVRPSGEPVVVDGRLVLTIPLIDSAERPVNVRFRQVPKVGTCPKCESEQGCTKCRGYRVCSGRPLPLFGSQFLSNDLACPLILVEGEMDVLAMHTYGYTRNVVSGTSGASSFAEEWLDEIEPYEQIVGFYDADTRGTEGWEKLVPKLGEYRCARATPPEGKDANDCLIRGVPRERMDRALGRAEPSHDIRMRRPDEYADDIETLVTNPDILRGIPTASHELNQALGGIRPGVIVVSGETNEGKTTFVTWLLQDLAREGYPVMLTSFEQRPIGTVQKLLRIQCGGDFTRVEPETRRLALDTLSELPLWVLDHYGHIAPVKMFEVIRYAKRRHGVKLFMVDHLGYLMDEEADDERRHTEAVMRALATVAHQMGVTIFLIAHPKNTPQHPGQRPGKVTKYSIKGTSGIRQDADDILIVAKVAPSKERPWPCADVSVEKVRSEFGVSGSSVRLAFDPGACVYDDEWERTPAGRDGLLVPRSARRS